MARTIQFEGAPLYQKQRDAIYDPARIMTCEASTKAGKAQPLNALIQTVSGPKEMGDIRVGDQVMDPFGGTGSVIGVFPQGEKAIYRVTFSDGTSAECCDDHLWEVRGQVGPSRVVSLSELRCLPYEVLRRTWVPVSEPVQYSTLLTNAYLLGALLGDGGFTTETLRFSSVDTEILARAALQLPGNTRFSHNGGCDYSIIDDDRLEGAYRNRVITWLRELDLWGLGSHEKFIPKLYKRSKIESRWDLVRGMMDTDGHVNKHGQPEYETTSQRLALDFQEVVQSLGGLVRIGTKQGGYRTPSGIRIECRTVYRCRITHPDASKFFHLTRKVEKCRPKKKPMKRTFRRIEFARTAQAQCIEVDSERGLYLTDNFIVTHNTVGCLAWIIEKSLAGRSGTNVWWVAPVYSQAEIAFRRCWAMLGPIKTMCKRNQSSMFILMPSGSRIWFKSGERPDDLYGEDVYAVVLDEASRMREEAWHAIRSTLTYTKGPVRIIGNVRGRKNWFYKLARLAESGAEDMAYHRLTAWDAVQAGVLDRKEIESAKRDFDRLGQEDVFRQLYMAEALDDASNPFGLQAIKECLIPEFSHEKALAAGVDLAGRGAINIEKVGDAESRDWTAIAMLDRNGNATYIDRFRRPHRETMNMVVQKVGRTMCLIDSTGTGDALVEDLQRRGDMRVLGYTFTERSRQDLLEGLALAIQEGSVHFPDVKTSDGKGSLRDELEAFEFQYSIKGVRYHVPEGISDDLTMALALAVKRMPWKKKAQMKPVGIPTEGGSRWNEDQDGSEAWMIYQKGKNPVLSDQSDPAAPRVAMPVITGGSTINRWSIAG